MLRKCTASTVENFHTCQIGKIPLLQELLLCVKHWFKELDPQAAGGHSQAFADTLIGQSLLKLDESQRKRLESLFNTKIR
jgi:hypothetical protein